MSSALDLITGALQRINSYQSGDQIAVPDENDTLVILNDLFDSWSNDKTLIHGTNVYQLQWNAGQFQYKVGNPTCTSIGEPPFTGVLASGSNLIGSITNTPSDLAIGATVTDSANVLPPNTTVTAIGSGNVTLSNKATATPNGSVQITYTIPGDFAIPRPLRITGGYTRINELDFWFDVYESQDEYNSILFKFQPGPWPVVGWYNPLMPYGVLNVYQAPGQAAQFFLFADLLLSNLTLTQTFILPQGYARAIKWALAEELWSIYWAPVPIPEAIKKKSAESMKMIKAINSLPPKRARYDRALVKGNRVGADWIMHGGMGAGY